MKVGYARRKRHARPEGRAHRRRKRHARREGRAYGRRIGPESATGARRSFENEGEGVYEARNGRARLRSRGGYGSALWVSALMAGLGAVAIALLPGERVKEESAEPIVVAPVPEHEG